MEQEFLNMGLDIIGLGVFNYEFGSTTSESPVIKVQRPGTSSMLSVLPVLTHSIGWSTLWMHRLSLPTCCKSEA